MVQKPKRIICTMECLFSVPGPTSPPAHPPPSPPQITCYWFLVSIHNFFRHVQAIRNVNSFSHFYTEWHHIHTVCFFDLIFLGNLPISLDSLLGFFLLTTWDSVIWTYSHLTDSLLGIWVVSRPCMYVISCIYKYVLVE